ncbi:MAG: hypothetical protein AAGJ82_12190 [Bacteroidota bacterium]
MQNVIRQLSLLVFLLFSTTVLCAQDTPLDIVYLQSGLQVKGIIVEYKPDAYVKLSKEGSGQVVTYPIEAVVKIEQGGAASRTESAIQEPVLSQVELKNGTTHRGVIVDYDQDNAIKLRLENGRELTFETDEIEKITAPQPTPIKVRSDADSRRRARRLRLEEWRVQQKQPRVKPAYAFRETGRFHTTSFSFSFGRRENLVAPDPVFFPQPTTTRNSVGFNLQHIYGQQFSRMVGVGLGLSYDAYDLEDGESILTPFVHYRGFLNQKNVSPYVAANAGYGFALLRREQGVIQADGGIMFNPEVGLRLGGAEKANFMMGLGMRMQKAYYVTEEPFSGNIIYRDLWYRRIMMNISVTF